MRIRQVVVNSTVVALMSAGAVAQGFAQTAVTLQSAAERGLIDYQFEAIGGSSGDSVRVVVKRITRAPNPLVITIPAGTILRSAGAGQSMVVSVVRGIDTGGGFFRPTSRITLSGTPAVTAILSAFCAEFEKDNPSATTRFTLEQPDSSLACILNRSRNSSIATQQAAVWMYTDRITFAHMKEKFDVSRAEWNAAEAVVTQCNASVSPRSDNTSKRSSVIPTPNKSQPADNLRRALGVGLQPGSITDAIARESSKIEFTAVTEYGSLAVTTTLTVRNVSTERISGLTVIENWTDDRGVGVATGSNRLRQPLAAGKTATIVVQTFYNPRMRANTWRFSHEKGGINAVHAPLGSVSLAR